MTVNINAANITSIRLAEQGSNPSTPASGFASLFVDANGDLATRKDAGGIKIATSPASGDYILTVTGTGTAARLNANQTFTGTNTFNENIVMANGKGIDFSATPGTGTSELFNDYEEGAWTPAVISTGTASGTATYGSQFGRYTRVGRVVHVEGYISYSGGTGSAGDLRISGLPFTSNSSLPSGAVAIGICSNITLTAANTPTAFVVINTQEVRFVQAPTGGGTITNVAYDAAGEILIGGSYTV